MNVDSVIKERRSIRKYQTKEIPQKLLEEVLEKALWAPSGMNKQDWKIVVVRGKKRDQLLEIVSKSDHSPPAPPRKEGVNKWVGF